MTETPADPSDAPVPDDPLQRALRDVPVPPEARHSAVAAALVVFDELAGRHASPVAAAAPSVGAVPAATPVTNVVPLRRRWRSMSLIGVAAAAVAAVAFAMFRPNASDVQLSDAPVSVAKAASRQVSTSTPEAAAGAAPAAAAPSPITGASDPDLATQMSVAGPLVADSAEQLRALLLDRLSTRQAAGAADAAPSAATVTEPSVASCLADRTVVELVVYQRRAAVLVDNGDGSYSVLDATSCAVVVTVRP